MNLLHYKSCKPPTRFGHPLWPFWGRCFYEGYVTKTTKPMYKHKIYIFILVHWLCCLVLYRYTGCVVSV